MDVSYHGNHGRKSVRLYPPQSEICCEIRFVKMILEFLGEKIEYPITFCTSLRKRRNDKNKVRMARR